MTWRDLRLGDVLMLQRGHDLPNGQREDGDVPVVSSSGITGSHNEAKATAPGVVTGRYGTIGEVFYVEQDYWPLNTALYVTDFKGNQPRFAAYLLRNTLRNYKSDKAAVPGVNRNVLHEIKVRCPDREAQERITSILSAYDDLIENNRRRIQLLEQSAGQLYKEWFVHLRFPGHEHVKIKDGVPEGWERVLLSRLCVIGRGGSPRPINEYLDGTVPWFKIGDATASESPFVISTSEKIIEQGVKKSVLLGPNELILSNSATCGVPYFTGLEGCIHDGWLYFGNLSRISKWFLYCGLLEKQRGILAGIGEGATQKNLNTDYIGRQEFLLPKTETLLASFVEIVEPIFSQIFVLAQINARTAKARDLLLPRLMSGELAA